MRSIFPVVVLAMLAAGAEGARFAQAQSGLKPNPVQPQGAGQEPQAASEPRAGPGPDEPDALSHEPSLEDKVAGFVQEFYLTGAERSRDELTLLYASTVEYFDSGRLARDRVLRDKKAYFAKWPKRDYKLIRDTLKAKWRPGRSKVLDVSFDYDFDVASIERRSRGRGRAALTLDLTLDGGRITREQGGILQRW